MFSLYLTYLVLQGKYDFSTCFHFSGITTNQLPIHSKIEYLTIPTSNHSPITANTKHFVTKQIETLRFARGKTSRQTTRGGRISSGPHNEQLLQPAAPHHTKKIYLYIRTNYSNKYTGPIPPLQNIPTDRK